MTKPLIVRLLERKSSLGYTSYCIFLPKKVVEELNLKPGDIFKVEAKPLNTIILKKIEIE